MAGSTGSIHKSWAEKRLIFAQTSTISVTDFGRKKHPCVHVGILLRSGFTIQSTRLDGIQRSTGLRVSGYIQLLEWLRRSNISKSAFAAEMGWSRPQASQYFHGVRRPSLETLVAIAERTGIPIVAWVDTRVAKVEKIAQPQGKNARINKQLTKHSVS